MGKEKKKSKGSKKAKKTCRLALLLLHRGTPGGELGLEVA